MRPIGKLAIAGVSVFAALQLIRPAIPNRAATAEVQAPPEVKRILESHCYSCHSDQRRLSWFDEIVPAYWLVRHDVLTAREHLNFSTLGAKPAAAQRGSLYEAVNMIQLGAMPLPQFVAVHPGSKVTSEELATMKAYLSPWSTAPDQPRRLPHPESDGSPTGSATAAGSPEQVNLATVSPEFNGLPFDATFEDWQPVSITDRGDNNTFRFILGNDIAVRAVRSGNISPWPDGARLAKIAWKQQSGADGLMRPGEFIQVELMVKDARRYKKTEGWGWGRWRGLDLKPYGKDAGFVGECTTCHLPVGGNDYVYTLPITPAKLSRSEVVNNNAALPAALPYQPLQGWGAITMYVDPEHHSMAMLFGNDAATRAARSNRGKDTASVKYPPGAVLALVTWRQREDPHWFGARIPDFPASVEFVEVGGESKTDSYSRFAGTGLTADPTANSTAAQRINFVTGLSPVQLP